jgi:hypothetical protein
VWLERGRESAVDWGGGETGIGKEEEEEEEANGGAIGHGEI